MRRTNGAFSAIWKKESSLHISSSLRWGVDFSLSLSLFYYLENNILLFFLFDFLVLRCVFFSLLMLIFSDNKRDDLWAVFNCKSYCFWLLLSCGRSLRCVAEGSIWSEMEQSSRQGPPEAVSTHSIRQNLVGLLTCISKTNLIDSVNHLYRKVAIFPSSTSLRWFL